MYMKCRHIRTSGLPCDSPALRGGHFCYYHSQLRVHAAIPDRKYKPIVLPTPDDFAAIQLSVGRINEALIDGTIDLKKAACLFQGLKIAAHFINPKRYFFAEGTVESAEQSAGGDQLGPRAYNCGEEDDCNECPYATADQCTKWRPADKKKDNDTDDEDDED
jgi:hypothetical protein